jgi:LPPG:FO 2-phospho-L-lactate transferase
LIENRNVVCLVGGVGGAKLAYGLAQVVPPERLTIIVNTGDDFWHYGLRICPDLDTIIYTLAGVVDPVNGWGLADETTTTLAALERLGASPWFRLGDKDLATHLFRTQLWQEGHTLTDITQRLRTALGVKCAILPMTNAPVATIIDSREYGELNFQVYFVKHRWQPQIKALRLDGIEKATVSAEVEQAMKQADCIVIGPSNPWLSVNPILSVPGMRRLIAAQDVPRVAVTPIIGGQAIKGPTTKIMKELGLVVSLETIADYYGDVLNGFIVDQRDLTPNIKHLRVASFDTLMDESSKRVTLAKNLLAWTRDWK